MPTLNWGSFLTFVLISTFTPGPNNISSSSMGLRYGYRKTIPYILGIMLGFFCVMVFGAVMAHTLYTVFPALEKYMRLIGATYIMWLAYKTFRSNYQFTEDDAQRLGPVNGLVLQAFNIKVWMYGLTLYTTFLASITTNPIFVIISALFSAFMAFLSTSTWALFGMGIKHFLNNPQAQRMVSLGLAALLVLTAIQLSGLI